MKDKIKITLKSKDSLVGTHGAYTLEKHDVDNLLGKLLTIIDAIGMPEKQEKSLKDLIKKEVWSSMSSSSYVTGKIIDLARNMNWELRDKNNAMLCSSTDADDRRRGIHPPFLKGDYELTFIEY